MNVSAVIVTRGNVDLQEIIESIPQGWEIVIWDNGAKLVSRSDGYSEVATDCSVYGRYAAIEHATGDVIYVQDDDCIVSDPAALVDELIVNYGAVVSSPAGFATGALLPEVTHVGYARDVLVANMPHSRWADFPDSTLVGWGAAFHRGAVGFLPVLNELSGDEIIIGGIRTGLPRPISTKDREWFYRTCDVAFSVLVPRRKIVDAGFRHLPWAEGPGRMFTTNYAEHKRERDAMLELARKVRDAG